MTKLKESYKDYKEFENILSSINVSDEAIETQAQAEASRSTSTSSSRSSSNR
jgi:hypothetical protein